MTDITSRFRLTKTGDLERTGNRNKGKLGTTKRDGFIRVTYSGKAYQASHIVFYLKHGRWPCGVIRYLDGDRSNFNANNLAEISNTEAGASARNLPVKDSTGRVYKSVTEAAKSVNRSQKSIRNAIKFNSTCNGMKWSLA
jgi:hypothetical protein